MESSNPTLNGRIFAKARAGLGSSAVMSIQGTVNKTLILLALVVLTAGWSWGFATQPENMKLVMGLSMAAGIGGLIAALATVFKPNWSPVTAPIYAALQGVMLGAMSAFLERSYPGIVIQAIGLTFSALGVMLVAYKTGFIRATDGFKRGMMIAMVALIAFYAIVWIASLFGVAMPGFINGATPMGITFSMFVVGLATLSFILDFDFIERASQEGLEKYMEWYGAFGLMVTLIWVYVEILRLLSKLNRRD